VRRFEISERYGDMKCREIWVDSLAGADEVPAFHGTSGRSSLIWRIIRRHELGSIR
jgi:hypothetical protein